MVNIELSVLNTLFCSLIIAGLLGIYMGNLWKENINAVMKMYLIITVLTFLFISYFLSYL